MKGFISEKQRNKLSEARKNWLKKVDPKILNEIYKKISEIKKKRYKSEEIISWNKGKKRPPFSEEWKKNLSNALKGRKCPQKAIIFLRKMNKTNNPMWNPETVKKAVKNRNYKEISRKTTLTNRKRGNFLKYSKRMKENNPMWDPIINAKVNKNPEYIKKRIAALIKKPNKKENLLINLINKNNFPYSYVGGGKKIIGSKNPDFIDESNKKIIELFGDYWHTKKARCYEETEKGRIEYFKKYGYDTLIIWEQELNNINKVLEKIKHFNQNQYN